MIKTERLLLVPIEVKYSKDLFELWSDFDVIKYINTKLLNTEEECYERVQFWYEEYTDKEVPNNLVVLLNNKAIGIIGFPIIDKKTFEFGFYYQFAKEYWGNGYATESTSALIEYINTKYTKATIYADVVDVNYSSISILKRLGFVQSYIEKRSFNGMDIIHFELK